jgi:uncharacterized protein (DUF486 family)
MVWQFFIIIYLKEEIKSLKKLQANKIIVIGVIFALYKG